MGKGSGNSNCRPSLTLAESCSGYASAKAAFQALVLYKSNPKTSMWTDKSGCVEFRQTDGLWSWTYKTGVYSIAHKDKVQQLHSAVQSVQTHGFKTRKDAIIMASVIMGPNTLWNINFDSLKRSQTGVWKLPNTNFTFANTNLFDIPQTKKLWRISDTKQKSQFIKRFKTRKAAVEYLFEKGQI